MDYPWLQTTYLQIIDNLCQGHGHHALLFKADNGIGAEQLSYKLANWLLCSNKQKTEPCNHCDQCSLFHSNNHPDYYYLSREDNKDISIEQIRNINYKMQQFAHQSNNKVVRIINITDLTEAAANALLKTLEEPQQDCYFLLHAESSAKILATIYSRCQAWIITTPNLEQSKDWLLNQANHSSESVATALRISYNRPLTALHILEQDLLEQRTLLLRQFWLFFKHKNLKNFVANFKPELTNLQIDWITAFVLDALKLKLGIDQYLICQDIQSGVELFAAQNSVVQLQTALQIIQQITTDLNTINGVNYELVITASASKLITDVFV